MEGSPNGTYFPLGMMLISHLSQVNNTILILEAGFGLNPE